MECGGLSAAAPIDLDEGPCDEDEFQWKQAVDHACISAAAPIDRGTHVENQHALHDAIEDVVATLTARPLTRARS